MGKGRVRTFPRKLTEKISIGKKKVHNGIKIRFSFLTLDVDIVKDVYKGLLINVRWMFFLNILKSTLVSKQQQKTPNKPKNIIIKLQTPNNLS